MHVVGDVYGSWRALVIISKLFQVKTLCFLALGTPRGGCFVRVSACVCVCIVCLLSCPVYGDRGVLFWTPVYTSVFIYTYTYIYIEVYST